MAQSSESWCTETTFDDCCEAFQEVVTDNHFLANLLHPKYKGKQLSEAEEAAWQLLLKLLPEHPEVIADLCAFTAGSDPFPASLLSSACVDRMSPVAWWTSVANCKCKVSPPLYKHLKHCTETTSSVFEFHCNWMSIFQLWSGAKQTYEIILAWKRQQNMWHATDSHMEMLNWTGLETEMNIGIDQDKLWNI